MEEKNTTPGTYKKDGMNGQENPLAQKENGEIKNFTVEIDQKEYKVSATGLSDAFKKAKELKKKEELNKTK